MIWRRGWDSNPRYGFPYARFRGEYFQPLSHLSAVSESRLTDQSAKRQRRVGSGCSAKQNPRRVQNSTASGEKLLQERRTLLHQNSGRNVDLMVQLRMCQHFKAGAHRTTLWIISAIHNPRHTRLNYDGRANCARFKCRVEG